MNQPTLEQDQQSKLELERAKKKNMVLIESLRELDRMVRDSNEELMKKLQAIAKRKVK